MAVSNPSLPSLNPSFENIQGALQQRAQLALRQPPSGLGTANAVAGAVKEISQQQRKFEQELFKINFQNELLKEREKAERDFEGRFNVDVSESDVREFENELGVDTGIFDSLIGRKFKDQKEAEEIIPKIAQRALELGKLQLEQEPPEQVSAPAPAAAPEGSVRVPVASSSGTPEIDPETEEMATIETADPTTGMTNKQKIEQLDQKIELLESQNKLSATASSRRFLPKAYWDDRPANQGGQVWRLGTYDRFHPEGPQLVRDVNTDPITTGSQPIKTLPGEGELAQFGPTGQARQLTGPEPIPEGEKAQLFSQLTEVQKQEIPKIKTKFETNPTFKSVQTTKAQTGNLLRLLSTDFESLTGQIKTNLARTIGQEKGPMTEQDISRAGGSEAVIDRFNIGFEKIKSGKFDKKTYDQFRDTVRLLNNNAIILEDALIQDEVNDAINAGRFGNVEPAFLREALEVPDATGLVHPDLKNFSGDEIKDTLQLMRDQGIKINAINMLKAATTLRKIRQRRKGGQKK